LTDAESNEIKTLELCREIDDNFLKVGRLLYDNFLNKYWM
jgi:hypothetical protein